MCGTVVPAPLQSFVRFLPENSEFPDLFSVFTVQLSRKRRRSALPPVTDTGVTCPTRDLETEDNLVGLQPSGEGTSVPTPPVL